MSMTQPTFEVRVHLHRETCAVFERARVGDALVGAESRLLRVVRVIREVLYHKGDWLLEDNCALVDIEIDSVDLHVFPLEETEEFVCRPLLVVVV